MNLVELLKCGADLPNLKQLSIHLGELVSKSIEEEVIALLERGALPKLASLRIDLNVPAGDACFQRLLANRKKGFILYIGDECFKEIHAFELQYGWLRG